MENVELWQALIIIVVLFSFFGICGFFICLSLNDNLDGEEDEQSEN